MTLNGYTLLGDSQLQRFARFCSLDDSFCFPGCVISELKIHLKNSSTPKKAILLIGSNDLLKDTAIPDLKRDYISLVRYLLRNCDKVVLTLCPVIPRKVYERRHWQALNYLNSLVFSFKGHHKVSIVDLKTHSSKALLKPHFFEKYFYNGRVDQLHLNKTAFYNLYQLLQTACIE